MSFLPRASGTRTTFALFKAGTFFARTTELREGGADVNMMGDFAFPSLGLSGQMGGVQRGRFSIAVPC